MGKTLYDKIWEQHAITTREDGTTILYIDRHLVHEVTSPQAFEGVNIHNRKIKNPQSILAVADHNIPTIDRDKGIADPISLLQIETLEKNCNDFNLDYFASNSKKQGIVHVIGPEQGFTQPGMTIVCGDSHTSTHGAFGALAFGIGTSEVEHVFVTQTLIQKKSKNMLVDIKGKLSVGVTAKDLIMTIIKKLGTAGGTAHVIEYRGKPIEDLSMEGRMTICNMSIEAGAKAGLIAPDQVTFDYLKGKPRAPKGDDYHKALNYWKSLFSDAEAVYDTVININASEIAPSITWGTSPEDVLDITDVVPNPQEEVDENKRLSKQRSLEYMGLTPGMKLTDIKIDTVFIGSCTNSRIEDLRAVSKMVKNRQVKPGVRALIVPGSGLVKEQAEIEGLDKIFIESGFEWREPGCSMCLAMNDDKLEDGERCASTSNRNFEGRQGRGGRTHLMSPEMAAIAAITGHLTDVRDFL